MGHGTLDLLAQSISLHTIDDESNIGGFRSFLLPVFLQSGGASCLHTAVDDSVPGLNGDSLKDLAGQVPFGIMNEIPDACSANRRKKAKAFSTLPPNVFGVDAECAAHQCHRIVESSERDMIGNVHAVHCTTTRHQSGLQVRGLQALLDEMDFRIGEPPREVVSRNREIAERTLLRRESFIAIGMQTDSNYRDAVGTFLRFWNGDWTKSRPCHYCNGCAAIVFACNHAVQCRFMTRTQLCWTRVPLVQIGPNGHRWVPWVQWTQ